MLGVWDWGFGVWAVKKGLGCRGFGVGDLTVYSLWGLRFWVSVFRFGCLGNETGCNLAKSYSAASNRRPSSTTTQVARYNYGYKQDNPRDMPLAVDVRTPKL